MQSKSNTAFSANLAHNCAATGGDRVPEPSRGEAYVPPVPPWLIGLILLLSAALAVAFYVAAQVIHTL